MLPKAIEIFRAKWRLFVKAHPLYRGMISYGVIWPTSCLIQQTIEGKNFKTYNWWRAMRFSFFGAFYVAPTLYCWLRLSTAMFPIPGVRYAIIKAIVEQMSYWPFATTSFYFFMSLLELKTLGEAAKEVADKFWPTYRIGVCIWPFLQTINFSVIPEHSRLVFVSVCSLMWTTLLSYLKQKDIKHEQIVEHEVSYKSIYRYFQI